MGKISITTEEEENFKPGPQRDVVKSARIFKQRAKTTKGRGFATVAPTKSAGKSKSKDQYFVTYKGATAGVRFNRRETGRNDRLFSIVGTRERRAKSSIRVMIS